MIAILEHIPPVELRRICTVSWKFYELAHQARLTVHRTITNASQLAAWNQIVEYAPSRDSKKPVSKLSLAIDYRAMPHGIPPHIVSNTLSAISRSLPRLARLSVCASRYFTECLLGTLSARALALRSLEIRQWETVDPRITTIPATLFACQPEVLRAVTLDVPLLSQSPAAVPAFSNVSVVRLTVGPGQRRLAIAPFFPAARELHLGILWAPHGLIIDLSNLSLRLLAVDNSAIEGREIKFTHCEGGVAAVEHTGISAPRNALFWPARASGMTGRMYYSWTQWRTVVELSNADGSWRSTLYLPAPASWSSLAGDRTLARLQRVPLVALTVDAAVLETLVQAPITLSELRELAVDLSAPAYRTSERHDWDWDMSWDAVHAVFVVSLSISCALEKFWPWKMEMVFSAPLACLGKITLFLCVLSCALCAVWVWDSLRRPVRAHAHPLPRLSCPSLECVRLFARNNTPLVLDEEGIEPVLNLLAHSRVRPRLVLDGVVLDLRTQLRVIWRTFRIPVYMSRGSRTA